MLLDRDTAICILKKLESVQPFPVHIMDREGIVIASSVSQRVGQLNAAAGQYLQRSCSPGRIPAAEADAAPSSIACVTLRHRIAGAIELENLPASDSACLELAKTVAELMLEREDRNSKQKESGSSLGNTLSVLVGVHPQDPGQLIKDLQHLGVDLSIPRTSLLLQLSKTDTIDLPSGNRRLVLDKKQYLYSVEQFLNQLPNYFYQKQDLILTDTSEQNAIVLSVNRRKEPESNAMYLFDLCRSLVDIAKKDYCLVLHAVVGIQCCDLSDYERQYEQLTLRLSSGKLLYPERNVFLGNSIVLGNFIAHTSRKVLQNIVSFVYGRLLASRMDQILLETLKTYFECDLNLTVTAQKLYTHRNTLQHRFKKIEELTGFSVHTTDGLLTLRLAFLCYSRLQAAEEDAP